MVDMISVSVIVMIGALNDDIIRGITIIRNQDTSGIVTGKFDFADVDLVHRGEENLPIALDHGMILVHGCHGDLRAQVKFGTLGVPSITCVN